MSERKLILNEVRILGLNLRVQPLGTSGETFAVELETRPGANGEEFRHRLEVPTLSEAGYLLDRLNALRAEEPLDLEFVLRDEEPTRVLALWRLLRSDLYDSRSPEREEPIDPGFESASREENDSRSCP